MDDKDVSAQIERKDFEEWVSHFVDRLLPPLQQAMENAKLSPADIDAVELIGGSTRIPIVKDTLAKFFSAKGVDGHSKLSTTLNQDEAVARGCALQCAIISPVFKVREFSVNDWNAFPVQMEWVHHSLMTASGVANTVMDVFNVSNSIPCSKV